MTAFGDGSGAALMQCAFVASARGFYIQCIGDGDGKRFGVVRKLQNDVDQTVCAYTLNADRCQYVKAVGLVNGHVDGTADACTRDRVEHGVQKTVLCPDLFAVDVLIDDVILRISRIPYLTVGGRDNMTEKGAEVCL